MNLTDRFVYEDEIERLEKSVKRLKKENDRLVTMSSNFAHKTWQLLKTLGLTDKEIFDYYDTKRIC